MRPICGERPVHGSRSSVRIAGSLICGLAVVICTSCSTPSSPDPERYLPDPRDARRAIEESLEAWRKSPELERTTPKILPVMFVDQSRKPDQRLREFQILGESPGIDGCRRFQVKLALEQPNESILASYYVFGQGPIWVYRAEDFEMMMHMDPMIKEGPPPAAAASVPQEGSSAEPKHQHQAAPSDPSREKIPVR
jgi:hypothetical protein